MIQTIAISILLLTTYCSAEVSYTVDTRQIFSKPSGSGNDFANNLKEAVDNAPQPDGYCFSENPPFPLDNSGLCGSNENIGWIFTFNFSDNEDSNYKIQFGTDFGFGAAIFVDGFVDVINTNDLWWSGNWNSDSVFTLDYDFTAGEHVVEVYGAEGCCDGSMDVRFARAGGDYQDFSISNLESEIPEYVPIEESTCSEDWDNLDQNDDDDDFTGVHINIGTRYGTEKQPGEGEEFGQNLVNEYNEATQPEGYCDTLNPDFPLSNGNVCGSNENILWRFEFQFISGNPSDWVLEFGTDFGRGTAVFIDDVFSFARTEDLWWAGNWESSAVINVDLSLDAGEHIIEVYGSEGCCDGNMDARFSYNGQDFLELNEANVTTALNTESQNIDEEKDSNNDDVPEVVGNVQEDFTGVSVNIETRYGTEQQSGEGEDFGQKLIGEFNAAEKSEGYCETSNPDFPLSNGSVCGSNEDILWKFEFKFYNLVSADWIIEFGTDFGRGVAVYIDDQFDFARNEDLWWAGNWDSSAVIRIEQTWGPGVHTVVVHGSEKCCDGAMDVRFSYNGGEFQEMTETNVESTVTSGDCVVLFDQCDYQGEQLVVCEDNPDTTNFWTRSIYVPTGVTATLYNTAQWEGMEADFSQSVDCMEGPDFQNASFLELHHITLTSVKQESKPHLKKNSLKKQLKE